LLVIPAIDLRAGRCVRLRQGEMSQETVYSDIPESMAVQWVDQGARRLHVVDLDGAFQGRPVNRDAIRNIVRAISVPVQLGGGIRTLDTIEATLELGVDQVILGTSAIRDPDFLAEACRTFPDRIILGIDSRGEHVAVQGWTEETVMPPLDLARRCEGLGISSIIYTDIHRDGMSTGPNLEATVTLARSVSIPVIASGGISGIQDVARIAEMEPDGVIGMITGRALYQGTLDLAEAIRIASGADASRAAESLS
jgi:phosphoribosylformimino-5-aminoimidazole carboxamide ribotide isomerase